MPEMGWHAELWHIATFLNTNKYFQFCGKKWLHLYCREVNLCRFDLWCALFVSQANCECVWCPITHTVFLQKKLEAVSMEEDKILPNWFPWIVSEPGLCKHTFVLCPLPCAPETRTKKCTVGHNCLILQIQPGRTISWRWFALPLIFYRTCIHSPFSFPSV